MNRRTKSITAFAVSLSVLNIWSLNAIGDEVTIDESNWHVIYTTATSAPILIEKSKNPLFGTQSERTKMAPPSEEDLIAYESSLHSATSTPRLKNSIAADQQISAAPIKFQVSVIDNSCTVEKEFQSASFFVCNEEPNDIEIFSTTDSEFFKLLTPSLPVLVKADKCQKITLINGKSSFDCSGIFGISFKARQTDTNQYGYFGAGIID